MPTDDFRGAQWIARAVPAAFRIRRRIERDRVDWVKPGRSLAQSFRTDGPVAAISIDVCGPQDVSDPFQADVKFSVALEDLAGHQLAMRQVEGPQIVWERFSIFFEVEPAAPAGEYMVVLRPERETIGWYSAASAESPDDDGVSPLPIDGQAYADGMSVAGTRLLGVETIPASNPVFRRTFELDSVPIAARLSATVLGTGIVTINGMRVGREALEPAVTDYDKTVLYRSWDVGHLLKGGANEIIIEAGRERYSARGGDIWGWHLAPWHREPIALARLELSMESGTTISVVTDGSWLTAAGPVELDRLFRGEEWVLRAGEADWQPATVVTPPGGELKRATLPPVRALLPVAPRTTQVIGRARVYDFGEVMVGRIQCRVTGAPGADLRVRYGEQLGPNGEVVCENALVAGQAQLDILRLEAETTDYVWEPQFGYRGFRWIQVETSGDLTVEAVRAVPLYTEVDVVGELTTDNALIQWIDGATARSFRNNLHGIPTDTPIYEKNGWTADAHLATEALLHHYDLRHAFGKWMDDHADSQSANGSVPQIVPTPGWGRTADPAWSSSAALIPWYLYREYGDVAILEQSADTARRLADHVLDRLDGGLWPDRSWGDWLAPGHEVAPEGMTAIGTIMAATLLTHVASILDVLGSPASADYAGAATQIGKSYHNAFFDPATGSYAVEGIGYRQSLNILPLAFGLVPEEHVDSIRGGLVDDLENRTAGHLDCGAIGVRYLLPVLTAADRDDLAITVLTRTTRPAWGVWFENGETTLLESWDPDARSRNHYFLGSVSSWIQQRVGAMRLTEPGWRQFEVAPVDDPRVRRAAIRHRTPLGEASVRWERGAGGWSYDITVPPGSVARLVRTGDELSAGRHQLFVREPYETALEEAR